MNLLETHNSQISDLVELDGYPDKRYIVVFGLEKPEFAFEKQYDSQPTWKTLMDDIMRLCKTRRIDISLLREKGSIQNGGKRCALPPVGLDYIDDI